jgi:predicted TIM-barrel fold metal-dependent hydrolase
MPRLSLRPHWLVLLCSLTLLGGDAPGDAPSSEDIRELKLRDWTPRPMLVVPEHKLEKPKFPSIDVHNHLGGGKQTLTADRVAGYLAEMNAAGVRTVVNLDGGWGERLTETIAALDDAHPGRFLSFALIDFRGIDDEGWTQRETERLEASFKAGAKGLKFHKTLGLWYRYKDGRLMPVDDPKLAPIFELCAKHKKPVMIHTADPAAFFTPLDKNNERWHELNEHPNWLFYGEQFPKREELLAQFTRLIARHPDTTFIGAHFGNNVEDLGTLGQWLDKYPNLNIDIDARISELGRQPYTARKFFLKYQDRIMFGTDTTPRREAFRIYYRFLETEDEYFDCRDSHHLQGLWMIYGIHLPDEVLEKVYYKNAERVLLGAVGNALRGVPADAPGSPRPMVGALVRKTLRVKRTSDFAVIGKGAAAPWASTEWEPLVRRGDKGAEYKTQLKALYSEKGLYFLMQGTDAQVTATMKEDFADLWKEDVFEVFLWPDERTPLYFEYEISPLGYELPILVPKIDGKFLGWRPWHYEGDRKIQKGVTIDGGRPLLGSPATGWTAEFFIPYALLTPLANVPPKPGATWRANFYRMDYDNGQTTAWDWSRVGPSFHDIDNFGVLEFE